jgi:hypothetical protein
MLGGRGAATWIGVGIILCDLIFMFVSYGTWRDDHQLNARLAFEKRIRASVPAQARFFAVPMFDIDDVMVLASRLKRQIERKPLACAKPNDYFLLPSDKPAAVEVRVLALMDRSQVALVRVIVGNPTADGEDCRNHSFQAWDKGDI